MCHLVLVCDCPEVVDVCDWQVVIEALIEKGQRKNSILYFSMRDHV